MGTSGRTVAGAPLATSARRDRIGSNSRRRDDEPGSSRGDGPRARGDLEAHRAGISGGVEGDGRSRWRGGRAARGRPRGPWRMSRAGRPATARPRAPRVPPGGPVGGRTSESGPTCSSTKGPSKASAGGPARSSTIHRSGRRPGRCSAGRPDARSLRPSPNRARSRPSPGASRTLRRLPSPAAWVGSPACRADRREIYRSEDASRWVDCRSNIQ